MDWLKSVKAGDEVAIRTGWGYASYASYTLGKIERTTPRQLILAGRRFWRDSGHLVGGSERYTKTMLVEPTEAVRRIVWREHVTTHLSNVQWVRASDDVLRAAMAALEKATSVDAVDPVGEKVTG